MGSVLDGHDRLVQLDGAGAAVAGRVAKGEDATIAGDEPIASTVGRALHIHDWLVELYGAGPPGAGGAPKREDPAIAGGDPATAAISCSFEPDRRGDGGGRNRLRWRPGGGGLRRGRRSRGGGDGSRS